MSADSEDVVDALQNLESAVERVEKAIKGKSSTVSSLFFIFIIVVLFDYASDAWHSTWRYALTHGIDSDKVTVQPRPHDCNFLAAPLGEKYCHYERIVSTVRWATSTTGNPIESYDEGKTWSPFTPDANVKVPQYSTIEEVFVQWGKKED